MNKFQFEATTCVSTWWHNDALMETILQAWDHHLSHNRYTHTPNQLVNPNLLMIFDSAISVHSSKLWYFVNSGYEQVMYKLCRLRLDESPGDVSFTNNKVIQTFAT